MNIDPLMEENERLRQLRFLVDLTVARLHQDPSLSMLEGLEQVERCRDAALELFPDKEGVFDLVLRPRFERILRRRWPHEMPAELGSRITLRSRRGP